MKTNLVTILNGKAVTSSLQIAKAFNREHKTVLQSIKDLDCSIQFKEQNFLPSFYISELHNGGQRKHPMYYLTKDGFTFLVMGFTGKKAGKFKEDYINAFNQMEQSMKQNIVSDSHLQNYISTELHKLSKDIANYDRSLSIKFGSLMSNTIHDMALMPNVSTLTNVKDIVDRLIYMLGINTHAGLFQLYLANHHHQEYLGLKNEVRNMVGTLYNRVM